MAAGASGPVNVLYGDAIHEATRSGDLDRMWKIESQAQRYLDSVDEVKAALTELRAEIGRRSGTPTPVYGCAIQEAIRTGDVERMRQVARQSEEWLKQTDEVRAALGKLHAEIARVGKH